MTKVTTSGQLENLYYSALGPTGFGFNPIYGDHQHGDPAEIRDLQNNQLILLVDKRAKTLPGDENWLTYHFVQADAGSVLAYFAAYVYYRDEPDCKIYAPVREEDLLSKILDYGPRRFIVGRALDNDSEERQELMYGETWEDYVAIQTELNGAEYFIALQIPDDVVSELGQKVIDSLTSAINVAHGAFNYAYNEEIRLRKGATNEPQNRRFRLPFRRE